MHAMALDSAGAPLAGSEQVHVIARRVVYEGGDWREIADTYLKPGEAATLPLA